MSAFVHLQRSLRDEGLFLNSEKTTILEPGSQDWAAAVDGAFDALLSSTDRKIDSGAPTFDLPVNQLTLEFRKNFQAGGDTRRGRAAGLRLLRIRDQLADSQTLDSTLRDTAIHGILTRPELCEFWYRIISRVANHDTAAHLDRVARQPLHPWVQFWCLAMLAAHDSVPASSLGLAHDVLSRSAAAFESTAALLVLAKHGAAKDHRLVVDHARMEVPIQVARGAAAASTFLPRRVRNSAQRGSARSPFIRSMFSYAEASNGTALRLDNKPDLLPALPPGMARIDGRLLRMEAARASADYD